MDKVREGARIRTYAITRGQFIPLWSITATPFYRGQADEYIAISNRIYQSHEIESGSLVL